jgi:anthranilate synthase component 1
VRTEDAELAAQLAASVKDRAEHVMLVDLARNDINRVCKPETVVVDSLMQVEKFSHVMHLTSQVSGMLRADQDRCGGFGFHLDAVLLSGH